MISLGLLHGSKVDTGPTRYWYKLKVVEMGTRSPPSCLDYPQRTPKIIDCSLPMFHLLMGSLYLGGKIRRVRSMYTIHVLIHPVGFGLLISHLLIFQLFDNRYQLDNTPSLGIWKSPSYP